MFSWVAILHLLGCFLDGVGSSETQVRGRLQQGRKMFNKLRPQLCCPQIPQEERLGAFCTTVGASVLRGSGCWTPSVRIQQLISIEENRWFRCMMGGRKEHEVEWIEWLRATKRAAHALRCRLGLPDLWHGALASKHGWAGHLARRGEPHPGGRGGSVAESGMVGDYEGCRSWQPRQLLEASEEKFVWRVRVRLHPDLWFGVVGRHQTSSRYLAWQETGVRLRSSTTLGRAQVGQTIHRSFTFHFACGGAPGVA